MITRFLFLLFCTLTVGHAATLVSDGSVSDVQSKIDSASDGDTVTIPSGSFDWTTNITIFGKGIRLLGQGAGRVVGRSTNSVEVGTGTKTFETQSGLGLTNNQPLRIERTGSVVSNAVVTGRRAYFDGSVTSYSGTTLEVNVTNAVGSGISHNLWIISTDASTVVTNSAGTATLIQITEDASHSVRLSGLRIEAGSGTGGYISIADTNSGAPTLIDNNYFLVTNNVEANPVILTTVSRGVLWSNSAVAIPFAANATFVKVKRPAGNDSWTTVSSMGTNDTDGTKNFYVENSDVHAFLHACDNDDTGRLVWRHNLNNHSGLGTHGADTSNYGQRHFEVYKNEFVWVDTGTLTVFNAKDWVYFRGGTGLVASNTMPDITSSDYPSVPEIEVTVMNLQRNSSPNPCWGADMGGGGAAYPAPRQVGFGYVTGLAGNDAITYAGDLEPIYVWQNSRTPTVAITDYGLGECTNPDYSTNYIVFNRDIYTNNTAKPNWEPYTYPHPLSVTETPAVVSPRKPLRGIKLHPRK